MLFYHMCEAARVCNKLGGDRLALTQLGYLLREGQFHARRVSCWSSRWLAAITADQAYSAIHATTHLKPAVAKRGGITSSPFLEGFAESSVKSRALALRAPETSVGGTSKTWL